ncbi:hypothetical protein [Simplicispira lacusdiani]|uniref:hypothetical protein n=1 Tax=Simplicispira lacusdiani TaxID=2213010 RepID=UPI00130077E7|nr:hypothetical protein [Simplicispira lacusdiani]
MTTKKGKTTGAAQRPTDTKPKAEAYISFNKAETAALQGVCLRSLRVYFELKWLANFRTGVVGAFGRQKLTYESIADRVAIPTTQGRSTASNIIDGKEVARIIQRLEQAGLVADVQNRKEGLTLRLPMSPMRALRPTVPDAEGAPQNESILPDEYTPQAYAEPFKAPRSTVQDATDDDEDDWGWDDHESAPSPATSIENGGNSPEKLPTVPMSDFVANPHEFEDFEQPDPIQSVLIKTVGQDSFSVHESVQDGNARSAFPNVCSAGAPTEPLGEPRHLAVAPFRGSSPNLNAGQIRERIRALYPQFSYLDTQVSTKFFQRAEGLGITVHELDEAARLLVDDPTQKLTAGSLFDCLVVRRQRPKRLPGGLVL